MLCGYCSKEQPFSNKPCSCGEKLKVSILCLAADVLMQLSLRGKPELTGLEATDAETALV